MGRVLDHRVYRAAFVPALVALFVAAFSLGDRPAARTTRLAPDAFDAARAFGAASAPQRNSLRELAAAFPAREAGSSGDARLADRVARWFETTGFVDAPAIGRERFRAETPRGPVELENVVATRQGLSSRSVVVLAHRDARRGPAAAELSGTAALLELARVLADRDLRKTVVLASVSGGTGGFEGARRAVDAAPGTVDAVLVLGDLASERVRRPWVVPWANGRPPAPHALRRTVEAALRREAGEDAGRDRASVQWARRALPISLSEQGVAGAGARPAVLVSASGERGPEHDAPISRARFETFGRGVLRALTATLDAGSIESSAVTGPLRPAFERADGIVVMGRLSPEWSLRLLVGTLLLPALLAAIDGFFRVRRRGLPMGRWLLWSASFALPFLLAWGWARLLDVTGAVPALPVPAAGGKVPLETAGWIGMASTAVVVALGLFALRPLLLRGAGPRGGAAAGGAAAATGLGLSLLGVAVWVFNPYAAAVVVGAAHLWLLAPAPGNRLRGPYAVAAVLGGLLAPLAVAWVYVAAWGVGPVEALWTLWGALAGGAIEPGAAIVLCALAGALCATIAALWARRRTAAAAPSERIVTRGPRGYAGPGSLGGTESALRR